MINVTTSIDKFTEEGVEYILKRYNIQTNHPHSVVQIIFDTLHNQTTTNAEGVAVISTPDVGEHHITINFDDETYTDEL